MADVKLTINGKSVSVPAGTTILDAAKKAGVRIPTLCAYEGMGPHAACRLCVVRVAGEDKEKLACAVKAAEGMDVTTDSSELFALRKATLTEMFRQHTVDCHHCARVGGSHIEDIDPKICENCFFCDCVREGFCELQTLAREFGISELPFEVHEYDFPVDESTDLIIRDPNKCVKCRRCVDVCKNTQAVGILGMVKMENGQTVGVTTASTLAESACIRCGRCVDVCPTGAVYLREHKDEIVYNAHSYQTHTAAMLCKCAVDDLQAIYKEKFTVEQGAWSLKKIGMDHVYSPGYARAASDEQAVKLLDKMLGKKKVILTSSYPAKNFLQTNYPKLKENFAFYDSKQKCFGDYMHKNHPDVKLINVSNNNGNAGEAHETLCMDFVVNPRELYRILQRTGGAPVKKPPCELEELDDYKKPEKYGALLSAGGWRINGEPEVISFEEGGKSYTAAICHNPVQAKKALSELDKYDVIKVVA